VELSTEDDMRTERPHTGWRKSSYSSNGTNCVEVWRKSSRSNNGTDCVEVAGTLDRLRDSKNPSGPVLHIGLDALLAEIKAGRFQ
jgi:hypothetical protein